MVVHWVFFYLVRLLGFSKTYELDWSDSSLVEQLKEAVLSVGAWLSEINNSSVPSDDLSFVIDSLSIALHVKLLYMGGKFAKSLTIGDDSSCWMP